MEPGAPAADPLIRWAAQAVPARGQRYESPDAVVVTGTGLNRRDRIVVAGAPDAVQTLLDVAVAEHPTHVVLGATSLVHQLAGVEPVAEFGWMQLLPGDDAPAVDTASVHQLTDAEVAPVLAAANPGSWVQAGEPAVFAWAGVRAGADVVSVAALAHCADDVAFLAGVATLPAHRGRGHSTAVCAFLRDDGRAARGTVALMVDRDNAVAVGLYERLGFGYRSVSAAVGPGHPRHPSQRTPEPAR